MVSSLKKEGFSPLRRKDHKDFLWTSSVLGALGVLVVPFFSRPNGSHVLCRSLKPGAKDNAVLALVQENDLAQVGF